MEEANHAGLCPCRQDESEQGLPSHLEPTDLLLGVRPHSQPCVLRYSEELLRVSLGIRKMKTLLKPETAYRLKVVGLASPELLLEPIALPGHNTHAQMVV